MWASWNNVCYSIRPVGIGRKVEGSRSSKQRAITWSVRGWRSYQRDSEEIGIVIKCIIFLSRHWVGNWICGRRVRSRGSRRVCWCANKMGWAWKDVVSWRSRDCGCSRSTVRDISSTGATASTHRRYIDRADWSSYYLLFIIHYHIWVLLSRWYEYK